MSRLALADPVLKVSTDITTCPRFKSELTMELAWFWKAAFPSGWTSKVAVMPCPRGVLGVQIMAGTRSPELCRPIKNSWEVPARSDIGWLTMTFRGSGYWALRECRNAGP